MATTDARITTSTDDATRTITVSRVFDAPRDLVFRAWTDPAQFVKWWGPEGFSATVDTLDATTGGALRFAMIAPDGSELPLEGTFREVIVPEKIVIALGVPAAAKDSLAFVPPDQIQEVTFKELGRKTRLTIRTSVATKAIYEFIREVGHAVGTHSSLGKLARLVESH